MNRRPIEEASERIYCTTTTVANDMNAIDHIPRLSAVSQTKKVIVFVPAIGKMKKKAKHKNKNKKKGRRRRRRRKKWMRRYKNIKTVSYTRIH